MSPDTFRLRYRQARSEAMKAIVHQFQSPAWETVMATIPPSVAEEDHDKFVKLVLEEFENLYEKICTKGMLSASVSARWNSQLAGKNQTIIPIPQE